MKKKLKNRRSCKDTPFLLFQYFLVLNLCFWIIYVVEEQFGNIEVTLFASQLKCSPSMYFHRKYFPCIQLNDWIVK